MNAPNRKIGLWGISFEEWVQEVFYNMKLNNFPYSFSHKLQSENGIQKYSFSSRLVYALGIWYWEVVQGNYVSSILRSSLVVPVIAQFRKAVKAEYINKLSSVDAVNFSSTKTKQPLTREMLLWVMEIWNHLTLLGALEKQKKMQ